MNCESAATLVDLYLYGELEAQREEEFESHLHGCESCKASLARFEKLHAELDAVRLTPPPDLLAQCRRELFHSPAIERRPSAWMNFAASMRAYWSVARPLGATALVALGFFASRLTTHDGGLANQASVLGEPIVSTIRSVRPDASGHVQISLDETRRRLVSGSLNDANIERLMLAAARDESNDGLRVESIGILTQRPQSADVRDALLAALRNDPNPGVRFKALDGLKGMTSEPEVRKTLSYVLQYDQNPGVRIQAIDLLTQHQDGDLVGTLQQLVTRESNSYVRQRCEKALEELNASVGTF